MARLPIFVVVWALFIALQIPVVILGLVVVPLLYRYRAVDYVALPWWSRPWANPEDWQGGMNGVSGASLPRWWVDERGAGPWSFYRYHAIRNPANGLRSFELLDMDIRPDRVKYRTNRYLKYYAPWYVRPLGIPTYWYLAWQGAKAGFQFIHHWNSERYLVLKVGWRVQPRDAHEDGDGLLHDDAGFASKFLPYRRG